MTCIHCGEPILEGEETESFANGPVAHRNCYIRGIIGSVAHLEKRCGCYVPGSDENDPPGMTKRQAADAAVRVWESLHRGDNAEDH